MLKTDAIYVDAFAPIGEKCDQEVVIAGHDDEPGPQVEGDGHAPHVATWGDAGHRTYGRHYIVNLKNIQRFS